MLESKYKIFGSPLVASNFTKANLSGLNFENANLIYARILGANLSKTINIIPEQVESTKLDQATQSLLYLETNWKGQEGNTRLKNDFEKN
jgi:uncharacterized protein YjbI with pentapeptide repeats